MCDTWVNLERFQDTFGVMPKAGVRHEFFINLCLGVIPKPYRCEAGSFYPFQFSISLFYVSFGIKASPLCSYMVGDPLLCFEWMGNLATNYHNMSNSRSSFLRLGENDAGAKSQYKN